MPQRKPNERISSTEIQGEDSYVVISKMTVREVREARKRSTDEGDMFELGIESTAKHVVDWNWVDNDGKSLPVPSENPEVMDDLNVEEMTFLAQALLGGAEQQKN